MISCNSKKGIGLAKEKEAIKVADIVFSDLSAKNGMKSPFLQYMDSDAALLRPNHYPIVGQDARKYFQHINDSSFTLTTKPEQAEVAASGEPGYNYDIYTYLDKDRTYQGTCVSVWKKQADGNWKYVLDAGIPGWELRNKPILADLIFS